MIRWLDDSGHMDRVNKIYAYYTDEWDSEFIDWLDTLHPLKHTSKVEIFAISEEIINRQMKCDIVVSTYVAPWVNLNDEQYQNLMKAVLHEDSFLLSVDPQNVQSSVRSALRDTRINNDNLYKLGLGLIPAKKVVTRENSSVEWSVWKMKKQQLGAGV